MKTIHPLQFAIGTACITVAASLYAPLSLGATNDTGLSPMSSINPTHEPVGDAMSDTAITTKVKASLLEQKKLSSTHVHVRTREGVVRLTGSVPSATQRQTAADVTHAVSGVKSVENHLSVQHL
ncbi:BON domain-containing protein [Cupriavidus basilensis]|uniref:BON domain-containing protein n=1 Tax=Cupriavidus basilensis TaxID=68895 RepID=UPI0039F66559